jgi:hypothetical protein
MPHLPADEDWLASRGIPAPEARRQIALLRSGTEPPVLGRAAAIGDGICQLSPMERDRWARLCRERRPSIGFFVPASGAATRMFAGLKALLDDPEALGEDSRVKALLACRAVRRSLEADGKATGTPTDSVRRLLSPAPEGLDWPSSPKAFLPFHMADKERIQTAVQAQMQECCDILGPGGKGTLHCSLSPEHLARESSLREDSRAISKTGVCALEFQATEQDPSTDTLCLGPDGEIARDVAGHPLLRAGGHGSLLANLARTPGELVLVKNIDNIQPRWRLGFVVPWRMALGGIALELRRLGDALLASQPGTLDEAACAKAFALQLARAGRKEPLDIAGLRNLADRPLRVCGMVRNDGAPGGGPFWVEGKGLQIVEQSEVSPDPAQQRILAEATHFNPVEMACCLRRPDGSLHELEAFRDPSRAFLSRKVDPRGVALTVLEHPGLWNGSMGEWLTVFVEIPPETFLPAKTVFDLAHPWRQLPEGT